jgi:hypothetical protein
MNWFSRTARTGVSRPRAGTPFTGPGLGLLFMAGAGGATLFAVAGIHPVVGFIFGVVLALFLTSASAARGSRAATSATTFAAMAVSVFWPAVSDDGWFPLLAVLLGWGAARLSRGPVWVTVLIVFLTGLAIQGLAAWVGTSGTWLAVLAMLAAGLLRTGVIGDGVAIAGLAVAQVRDWVAGRSADRVAEPWNEGTSQRRQVAAERATAAALAALPKTFTVLHGRRSQDGSTVLPHVVVGPTGVFLLASAATRRPVQASERDGIRLGDLDLGSMVAGLLKQRSRVAYLLQVAPEDVSVGVVVHGAMLADGQDLDWVRGAAFTYSGVAADPYPQVTILSPAAALQEIDHGLTSLPGSRLKVAAARAKLKLHRAGSAERAEVTGVPVLLGVVSADGQAKAPVRVGSPTDLPAWMKVGAQVDVVVDGDTVERSWRLCSEPFWGSDHNMLVEVCSALEWDEALILGRAPVTQVHPLLMVRPTATTS